FMDEPSYLFHFHTCSYSTSLKPTVTFSPSVNIGRLINIPFPASNVAISSSVAVGITSFKLFSRYTLPLVLKYLRGSSSLISINVLISSFVGVSSTRCILVNLIHSSSYHFFEFFDVLHIYYTLNVNVILLNIYIFIY